MEIVRHRTSGGWFKTNFKVLARGDGEVAHVILTAPPDKTPLERSANITLASAAPELLESLEELVHYFNDPTVKAVKVRPMVSKAQKAIEKAKGTRMISSKGVDNPCGDPNHVNKSEVMEIVNNAINNLR